MRLFKSEAEIACMRRAAEISVLAHKRAMQTARYAHHEYALEAEIRYELIRHGCRHLAYESIVAGGNNACVLHYTANNQPLKSGELVLIDAGGEWDHYAADITRVFPPSGQFSTDQRLIYGLVLRAQKAGIACIKPGIRWNVIQQTMVKVLTEGLVELGLLQGCVSDLVDKEAYRVFYMHSSGHWLGLVVLDCGRYKIQDAWRLLEPGMVLTVEPGIYIQAGLHDVAPRWWGIGVRIEDDILVTEQGHENLTAALQVTTSEIEAFLRG
jgi:Xaa-Pro aminopeptidase